MEREKARIQYREDARAALEAGLQKLAAQYERERTAFAKQLYEGLEQLCAKAGEGVCYFQISLLRCLISQGTYRVMLSAHNQQYFLDREMRTVWFDADGTFGLPAETRECMDEIVRDSQGRYQYYDADREIARAAMDFFKSRGGELRHLFRDFDRWDCVRRLRPGPKLVVKWGEHRELSETLFLMEREEKTQEAFEKRNRGNDRRQWNDAYVYQSWDFTQLAGLAVREKSLLFAGLRGCHLTDCRWESCLLTGAALRDTQMERVDFINCDLHLCDFRNVRLRQVRFFGCNLSGADFLGAQMEETAFADSDLTGACFSREALACPGLSAAQLQQLIVKEEPYVFYDGRGWKNTGPDTVPGY